MGYGGGQLKPSPFHDFRILFGFQLSSLSAPSLNSFLGIKLKLVHAKIILNLKEVRSDDTPTDFINETEKIIFDFLLLLAWMMCKYHGYQLFSLDQTLEIH